MPHNSHSDSLGQSATNWHFLDREFSGEKDHQWNSFGNQTPMQNLSSFQKAFSSKTPAQAYNFETKGENMDNFGNFANYEWRDNPDYSNQQLFNNYEFTDYNEKPQFRNDEFFENKPHINKPVFQNDMSNQHLRQMAEQALEMRKFEHAQQNIIYINKIMQHLKRDQRGHSKKMCQLQTNIRFR